MELACSSSGLRSEAIREASEAITTDGGTSDAGNSSTTSTQLELQVSENACAANLAQNYFEVTNGSAGSVALSDITVKFWINDTSGVPVAPEVSYGGCVTSPNGACVHTVSGVKITATPFSPACGPDANHQANWEIAVSTTDSTPLAVGQTWNNVQTAVNLSNYANFVPGTKTWFSGCGSGGPYAANPAFAVYDQGNMVFSNGINAPSCRAPHGLQVLPQYAGAPLGPLTGPVPPGTTLKLALSLPVPNLSALQAFADEVSDPSSPQFRQFITPDKFASMFGPLQTSYAALSNWATSSGLTVIGTYSNNMVLAVTGTVAAIEQALFLNLNYYVRPDGTQFYAPDRSPSLNLSVPVLPVQGLDNYQLPSPGVQPDGNYLGNDFRIAYAPCTALTGAGQTVGILTAPGKHFYSSDIQNYINKAGTSPPTPIAISVDGVSTTPANGEDTGEQSLDIEMVLSMAPGAQVFEFEGDTYDATLSAMATCTGIGSNNTCLSVTGQLPVANQLSNSWNFCGTTSQEQTLLQMKAQGQSFFSDSSDFGAYPVSAGLLSVCAMEGAIANHIDYLDGVTIVGGTILTLSVAPEMWNLEAGWPSSGGGILSPSLIPSYQINDVPSRSLASTIYRNAPDVAAVAQNIELYADNNSIPTSIGGTSASTPLWAGFMALVNQQAKNNGLPRIGFANPEIYAIGANAAAYASDFHDVKDGTSNGSSANPTGYQTVAGYDLVTGWGSPKCNLISDLSCVKLCGGVCANFATDSNNCGACGHSCGGGACSGSVCQPLLLGTANEGGGIAVGSGEVYWTTAQSFDGAGISGILAAPSYGGPVATIVGSGTTPPTQPYNASTALTADGTYVYFYDYNAVTNHGALWKANTTTAPIEIANVNTTTVTIDNKAVTEPLPPGVFGLAVDSQNLYWADASGDLSQVQLSSNNVTNLDNGVTSGIASDGSHLFYFARNSLIMFSDNNGRQTIASVSAADQPPVILGDGPGGGDVAAASGHVCWITSSAQQVECASISASPQVVYTYLDYIYGVATDRTNVFFSTYNTTVGEYDLNELPISGGTGTPVVLGNSTPAADIPLWFAVDSINLYWTTTGEFPEVFKLALPL